MMTDTARAGGWTLHWAVFALLAVLLPIAMRIPGQGDTLDESTLMALGIVVVSAWSIARIIGHAEATLVALSFWVFMYLFGGLATIVQGAGGDFLWPGTYSDHERFVGTLMLVLAVLAWAGGYRFASRRPMEVVNREINLGRVRRLGYVGLACSAMGVAKIGLDPFLESRQALSNALTARVSPDLSEQQIVLAITVVPSSLALVLLLWTRPRTGFPFRDRALFVLLSIAVAITANPISSARFFSGSILLALLLASRPSLLNGRTVRAVSAAFVAAVILVFPIADAFRFSEQERGFDIRFDRTVLARGDYDAFQQTLNARRYVEDNGFQLGHQIVGVPLFWLPRAVWTSKPEPSGVIIARNEGYEFTNLSSPAWTEGYLDLAWAGIAVVMLGLGFFAARLDSALTGDIRRSTLGAIAPFYIGYQFIILRGSLMAVIGILAVWCALSWLVCSPVKLPQWAHRRL